MGVGDVISKLTSAVGIKPCGGCRQRAEKLNKLFSFTHNLDEFKEETCGKARLVKRGTAYTVYAGNYSHTFCCGDLVSARKELARLCR